MATVSLTPRPDVSGAPLSTLSADGRRRWIHPVVSKGRFFWVRSGVAAFLVVLFVGLPHLRIAGKPAMQLDLGARQLHLFGTTLFATDTVFLAAFGVSLLLSIAVVTALFGRVWCGWACPQPIYMEFVFRPIETLFEGPPGKRVRRQRASWDLPLVLRKAAKWTVYVALCFVLANTFVAYFVGTDALWDMMVRHPYQNWGAFLTVAFVTVLMLGDFGYFREQTCIIACPYGRLQSALIDANSLIVGYDTKRGEPRTRLVGKKTAAGAGDCVDCQACVRTCPTGIDIRHGLQLECTACTQCIDACNGIMDHIGKPRGLIRYTSLRELDGHESKIFRPRVLVYLFIAVAAISSIVLLFRTRLPFEADVVRVTGSPFTVQSDGMVINRFRLRITNRKDTSQAFRIEAPAPDGLMLMLPAMPLTLGAREVSPVEGAIRLPRTSFAGKGVIPAKLRIVSLDGSSMEQDFTLLGPMGDAT